MNLKNENWIVGEDYWAAPTSATCHMSQTKKPTSHAQCWYADQLGQPSSDFRMARSLK